MKNIKAIISYDGTRFNGWQSQKNSDNTIQATIENALSNVFGQKTEIIASGRTDAGVHALAQVINFAAETNKPLLELLETINAELPGDISVRNLSYEAPRFHARYNVKSKVYLYRILNDKIPDPFLRKYSLQYPSAINLELLERASRAFVGIHDFSAFTTQKKSKKSTSRTIYKIEFKKIGNELQIFVHGDGFLYNMVRIIVGTLLEVNEGKIKCEDLEKILRDGNREAAGFTAPPQGLFLYEAFY